MFAAFYDSNVERVLVFFARRCADAEVAADLAAETFARAYAGRAGYRGRSDAEAEAWLFGIAQGDPIDVSDQLRPSYVDARLGR